MHQRGQEINSDYIQMTTKDIVVVHLNFYQSKAKLILVCTLLIGTKLVDT